MRPFPNVAGSRWQVSYNGGFQPLWSSDSRELFFTDPQSRLNGVRVGDGAEFSASTPQPINDVPIFAVIAPRTFDISRDDKRFLVIQDAAERVKIGGVTVVVNWAAELKRLTAR